MTTTVCRSTTLFAATVPAGVFVSANRQYIFQAFVAYSTDWEAGLRYTWKLPPGAELTTKWAPTSSARQEIVPRPDYNAIAVDPLARGLLSFREWGLLTVGPTDGFVCLYFAQDVPHHTPTMIHPSSYVWLTDANDKGLFLDH